MGRDGWRKGGREGGKASKQASGDQCPYDQVVMMLERGCVKMRTRVSVRVCVCMHVCIIVHVCVCACMQVREMVWRRSVVVVVVAAAAALDDSRAPVHLLRVPLPPDSLALDCDGSGVTLFSAALWDTTLSLPY